jgi:hypothetical protein
MMETQIICCEPCKIPDLSLDLHRGEEVWVANELAKNSKDLKRVLAIGQVRVYQRMRDKKARRHAPPSYQRLKPKVRTQTPAPEKPAVEKVIERVVEKIVVEKVIEAPDTEALAAQIKRDLLGEMAGTIEAAVAAAMAAQAPPAPTQSAPALDAATMAAIVQQAVAAALPAFTGGVVVPAKRREQADDEVPLYLPTGIVDKDVKAEITVKSESKDSNDLDEAAKLLREMKRRKKQTDKDK